MGNTLHKPVLFESLGGHPSIFDVLEPKPGDSILDCTVGLGGHAEEFMKRIGVSGSLMAFDADKENVDASEKLLGKNSNVTLIHSNFRELSLLNLPTFDVIFADLGISSPHLDDPGRGFSFRFEGPLDLRLDRSKGETAADLLERASEKQLFEIFADLGEVPRSSALTKHLLDLRTKGTHIKTTTKLKSAVEEVFAWKAASVLPQVFQALRMAVNDELGALRNLLDSIPKLLNVGGRAGIISFHSLEDRMTKQAFREWSSAKKNERTGQDVSPAPFILLTKKPVTPSPEEISKNPRSRSAKFRAVQKRS